MTALEAMHNGTSSVSATASGTTGFVPSGWAGTLEAQPLGPDGSTLLRLDTTLRRTDARGWVFSSLFSPPVEGCSCQDAAGEVSGWSEIDIGDDPEGAYFQAAVLVAGGRMGHAARLLCRLQTVTGGLADRQRWRPRLAFLWAVHGDRVGRTGWGRPNCQEAGHVVDAGPKPSGRVAEPGPAQDFLSTVDAVVGAQLPRLTAQAATRLDEADDSHLGVEHDPACRDSAQGGHPDMLAVGPGPPNDAFESASVAPHSAATSGGATKLGDWRGRMADAEMLFEQNELEAAQEQLEAGLRRCYQAGDSRPMWALEVQLVRVMIAQQRVSAALPLLHRLRRLDSDTPGQLLVPTLGQVEIEAWLAHGDVDQALSAAQSASAQELRRETLARLDLRSGRPDRALTRLTVGQSNGLGANIRRLVLLACAERQLGRAERATHTVRRAAEAARPARYVRPFLEEPTPTLSLLNSLVASAPDRYISHLVSQANQLVPAPPPERSPGLLEPLTERQRQVLRYLPSRLNQHQIGIKLGLSRETIRTHIKAIYRKMGATSRDDAVAIARNHGLL